MMCIWNPPVLMALNLWLYCTLCYQSLSKFFWLSGEMYTNVLDCYKFLRDIFNLSPHSNLIDKHIFTWLVTELFYSKSCKYELFIFRMTKHLCSSNKLLQAINSFCLKLYMHSIWVYLFYSSLNFSDKASLCSGISWLWRTRNQLLTCHHFLREHWWSRFKIWCST